MDDNAVTHFVVTEPWFGWVGWTLMGMRSQVSRELLNTQKCIYCIKILAMFRRLVYARSVVLCAGFVLGLCDLQSQVIMYIENTQLPHLSTLHALP